jgi:integrase
VEDARTSGRNIECAAFRTETGLELRSMGTIQWFNRHCADSRAGDRTARRLCGASRSRSLLPVVSLALATGMRHDELRLLRWKQIDFTNTAIKVGRSKTEHGAGRAVPLNKRAIDTLTEWAKQFPDRKANHCVFPSEKVGIAGNDEIVEVFDTDPTNPITSWKTAWSSVKTASGVECRFHDLRHTVVTRLLEASQPFAVVADIMGWSAATAVRMAKRYGHIGPSASGPRWRRPPPDRRPFSESRWRDRGGLRSKALKRKAAKKR